MSDSAVEARLARLQAWIVAGLAFMFVSAVMFLVVVVVVVVGASHAGNQALACFIQPQLDRAEETLPTLQYYKEHPKELGVQLDLIDDQRKLALQAWGSCDSLPPR